jgi:hypothetical protein
MTKLIQILIAERDRKARLINDAANSSVTERKALIAQLNDAIEDAKKSVERCEDLINNVDRVEERHWGREIQYRGLKVEELVRRASQGDLEAHSYALCQAGLALRNGESMPRTLEVYISKMLIEDAFASRGRGRPVEWVRNFAVVHLLNVLKIINIAPTRNCATDPEQECGSRLIAEWLNEIGDDPITEAGVAKIWEKYHEQLLTLMKQK